MISQKASTSGIGPRIQDPPSWKRVEYKDICLENLSRRQAPDITMDALHLTTAHSSTDTRIFNKEAKQFS